MRGVKAVLAIAVSLCVMGIGTVAWACPIVGKVVCTGTTTPVEGVDVVFDNGVGDVQSDVTDASGLFDVYVTGAGGSGAYVVNLNGATIECFGYPIDLTATPFEVDAPGCGTPPPASSDCSPGYYKKHPEAWCMTCGYGAVNSPECLAEVAALSTRGSDGTREAAKARIDACFDLLGGAAASPCVDDDP